MRRSADRYSGEQHFAAANIQKQISKLNTKFTRFESKMAARHHILETSAHLQTSLRQWREQCKMVLAILKQESSGQEGTEPQDVLVQELQQIGNVVLDAGQTLLELVIAASEVGAVSEDGEGSGRSLNPDYSRGISQVRALMSEVENNRRRLRQLAEARAVQNEQLKQIDTCEKDAKQVRVM